MTKADKTSTDIMLGAIKLAAEEAKEAADIAGDLPKDATPRETEYLLFHALLRAASDRNWTRAMAALHLLRGVAADKPKPACKHTMGEGDCGAPRCPNNPNRSRS